MIERLLNREVVVEEHNQAAFNGSIVVVLAYSMAIVGAEVLGVFGAVGLGALCQALLIPVLLSHYALAEKSSYRRMLPALALLPLLRLLSLTLPIREAPQLDWYAIIGLPLLLAAVLTIRLLALPWWTGLSLRWPAAGGQIAIAVSGLPLGLAAFLILRPQPLIVRFNWPAIILAAVSLMVFSALVEELIFRSIIQEVAIEALGPRIGLLYSSGLFAVMYIGSLSLGYVLFIGSVGFLFGWCVRRTGLIWGVVLAHSLLIIGLLLIWPFII